VLKKKQQQLKQISVLDFNDLDIDYLAEDFLERR
jgi:hypothetical protein